jgi:hypothetical protein
VSSPEPFEPRNDLERQLLAAQEGRLAPDAFMAQLLDAQVFLPVRDDDAGIQGFQASDKAVPLLLDGGEGYQVLVVFTSPERARDFLRRFPGYEGGLLTDFRWILKRVGAGIGISLNPGWEVGMDMEPGQVQQLAGGGR